MAVKRRPYRAVRRLLKLLIVMAVLAAITLGTRWMIVNRPGDLPFTSLALDQPVGKFTGRKLTALTQDREQCFALLDQMSIAYRELGTTGSDQCRTDDRARLPDGLPGASLRRADVAPSCAVSAALVMWNWNVVQPAARDVLSQRVVRIDHLGSFSCRRMYGRSEGAWSKHATADAIDIVGFVLEDGSRISVLEDWPDETANAAFLRRVRDGGCDLFATVLSPDYNAAHADHFHFDQADRGEMGWRVCR